MSVFNVSELEALMPEPEEVRTASKALLDGATAIDSITDSAAQSWGRLQAPDVYVIDGAEVVHSAYQPITTASQDLADDLGTVDKAANVFADAAVRLKSRLATAKADAEAFDQKTADDEDWNKDKDLDAEQQSITGELNSIRADLYEAERDFANAIKAIYGGDKYVETTEAGAGEGEVEYGFSRDSLNTASMEGNVPWAHPREFDKPWLQDVGDAVGSFAKGVWSGIKGTVTGLGNMVGLGGADAFAQTWKGLGKLATDLAIVAVPGVTAVMVATGNGQKVKDAANNLVAVGKAAVHWDEWKTDPAYAAGASSFDLASILLTAGAGATAKVGSVASKVGDVAATGSKVGKAVEVSGLGKAANVTVKITDMAEKIKIDTSRLAVNAGRNALDAGKTALGRVGHPGPDVDDAATTAGRAPVQSVDEAAAGSGTRTFPDQQTPAGGGSPRPAPYVPDSPAPAPGGTNLANDGGGTGTRAPVGTPEPDAPPRTEAPGTAADAPEPDNAPEADNAPEPDNAPANAPEPDDTGSGNAGTGNTDTAPEPSGPGNTDSSAGRGGPATLTDRDDAGQGSSAQAETAPAPKPDADGDAGRGAAHSDAPETDADTGRASAGSNAPETDADAGGPAARSDAPETDADTNAGTGRDAVDADGDPKGDNAAEAGNRPPTSTDTDSASADPKTLPDDGTSAPGQTAPGHTDVETPERSSVPDDDGGRTATGDPDGPDSAEASVPVRENGSDGTASGEGTGNGDASPADDAGAPPSDGDAPDAPGVPSAQERVADAIPEVKHRIEINDFDKPKTAWAKEGDVLQPNTQYDVAGRGTFYTDENGKVAVVTANSLPDRIHPDLNRPLPNVVYQVNDVVMYRTDSNANTVYAFIDDYRPRDGIRSEGIQRSVGGAGFQEMYPGMRPADVPNKYRYDGGHLIGTQSGGVRERINLQAMLRQVNQSVGGKNSFYRLEQQLIELSRQTPPVRLTLEIESIFDNGGKTPTEFVVEHAINGEFAGRKRFINASDGL
ncbi:DNA/RNA non-specific endonuclease [Arthrobacter sp. zg-Y179]|uniref:DNA/RNA non-specific endonuclease n=1 Tax=Arthrobacter sp. zg-Y179 TaxID=2894188 RepID=UPI001E45271B|nr:DNA/RNA non-specific endonuclease [Arthrobacter sp. zg-Y179]MCC9176047.1 DNA/RNA non-specific endonuclease [Arthrobacter sp. zg-Y179]